MCKGAVFIMAKYASSRPTSPVTQKSFPFRHHRGSSDTLCTAQVEESSSGNLEREHTRVSYVRASARHLFDEIFFDCSANQTGDPVAFTATFNLFQNYM